MGAGSNRGRVSRAGGAARGRSETTEAKHVSESVGENLDEGQTHRLDEAGCLTEDYLNRVLPPIPKWMREAPRPKAPTLFDDQ